MTSQRAEEGTVRCPNITTDSVGSGSLAARPGGHNVEEIAGPMDGRDWTNGEPCTVPGLPVHEMFRLQARRCPEALALRQWQERLTYCEVEERATALVARLASSGVRIGTRVGICMRRGLWLPIAELAVLMSGGAFVPLDPDQPAQRLRGIVADAGIEIAVTDGTGAELLPGSVDRIVVERLRNHDGQPPPVAEPELGRNAIAYVMYTSGSTGQPKGVMVSHRNLAAFVTAINQHLGEAPGYELAAFAAVGFDVSVFEFFAPLSHGSALHLVPDAERADADLLQNFLEEHQSSHAFLPPALLPLLNPGRLGDLRSLIVGGEACDPRQVGRWTTNGRRFYNWYGPTEATVAVVGTELHGDWERALPIGRPLPGSRIYIVDDQMKLCAPGETGELLVGGPQVSLGYVARPEETAIRFVPDPFQAGSGADTEAEPGGPQMLYRTGDLARWERDGMISFLGRADRQLKIHGRRVEPAEIETVLSGHPKVDQAVVDVTASTIRAYVTPLTAPPGDELREYCARWLPRQMIPATVIALAQLPMTLNAKVDFAALARLSSDVPAELSPGVEPEEDFQRVVAQIWTELFDVARPHLDSDFFADGGDSLSAMQLASTLRRVTGRALSVPDVFAGRTVGGIAELLRSACPAERSLPSGSDASLSSAQRRVWFVEQFAPGSPLHNIVLAERISGALDVRALECALETVTKTQEALRWRLRPGHGLPDVTVASPAPVRLPIDDHSGLPAPERQTAIDELLTDEAATAISLTDGPLWRARLLRMDADDHVLVITLHHIIFDGWSQAVLYRELGRAYQRHLSGAGADSELPSVTFADYVAWTTDAAARADEADVAWWHEHLAGAPAVLDLPRDRPRPAVMSFTGATSSRDVGPQVTAAIGRLAADQGTTVGAVLLAGFSVLLGRLTGQRDMVIGVPVADRGHAEFEELIGFFVRVLPLRLRIDDGHAFAELVRHCGDELALARQHADVPLERIVDGLGIPRDVTRNPLFQVMFNVYNFAEPQLDLGGPAVEAQQVGIPGSQVDLTVYVIFRADGIRLEAAYNRDLYDPGRIEELLGSYVHLLGDLLGAQCPAVGDASSRSDASRLPGWSTPLSSEVAASPGLVEQVRAIGQDRPDQVVVEHGDCRLSYAEVLRGADAISDVLRATGVSAGDAVAVLAERTAILPSVLLGVLSTGARWVVLEPDLPQPVLDRRLGLLQPRALIWCGQDRSAAPAESVLPVVDARHAIAEAPPAPAAGVTAPAADVAAAQRGYLSLTSGTTGEPKAVRTSEAPLVHFVNWYRAAFGLSTGDRFALLGGVAHDPLLRELFTPLTCGGRLVIPRDRHLLDPRTLVEWLADQQITVAHVTPPLLRMMASGAPHPPQVHALRLVAVGGDQLTWGDVALARQLAPHARLLNCYGTTETPQVQAYYEIPAGRSAPDGWPPSAGSMRVPVGRGIDGAQLLVLNAAGKPTGVGELGEVAIRSRHLSDGYLDPVLTRERYAPSPDGSDGRVFRTGDLGRYDPAGLVTLAGRLDDQVKIRGFRVELGEVEAALTSHPAVDLALAQVVASGRSTALHGYVTSARGRVDETDILRHARSQLPAYAVPSAITVLAELPMTPNGKPNRARLPRPRSQAEPRTPSDRAPEGDLERLIMSIWCEVLSLPWLGKSQNFFEIGGHSLAIVEVQSRLTRALNQPVSVVELFQFPTVRSLAEHLASGSADTRLLDSYLRGRMRRQQQATRQYLHTRRERSGR